MNSAVTSRVGCRSEQSLWARAGQRMIFGRAPLDQVTVAGPEYIGALASSTAEMASAAVVVETASSGGGGGGGASRRAHRRQTARNKYLYSRAVDGCSTRRAVSGGGGGGGGRGGTYADRHRRRARWVWCRTTTTKRTRRPSLPSALLPRPGGPVYTTHVKRGRRAVNPSDDGIRKRARPYHTFFGVYTSLPRRTVVITVVLLSIGNYFTCRILKRIIIFILHTYD